MRQRGSTWSRKKESEDVLVNGAVVVSFLPQPMWMITSGASGYLPGTDGG